MDVFFWRNVALNAKKKEDEKSENVQKMQQQ